MLMEQKWLNAVIVLGLLSATSFAAHSADTQVSANLGFNSKYMWRGWEINKDPSGYASVNLGVDKFYTGIWGGTDGTLGTEIDLYFGYADQLNDHIAYDVGFIQYRYDSADIEVEEWHLTLDFNFVSTTYHRGEDGYNYIELNKTFELQDKLTLDLHIGREDRNDGNLTDYGATLNYQINDNYRIYLAATDKQDHDNFVFVGIHADF